MGREPGGDEEPSDLRLAEDELVVGRERLRAVDDPIDASVRHRRNAPDRAFHDRLEALHVGCQELAIEVGRDTVERPGSRIALVAAHAQAADLLAEVDEVVGVAELREAGMDALDRLGEEVLVGHRDDRNGHADQPGDLRGEHPAGVHHHVGADLRAVARVFDRHAGDPAAIRADGDDRRLRADPGATLPGAGGQGVGEPRRIQPAIGRQVQRTEHALGRHEREAVLRLLGRDQVERQAECLRPAGLAAELIEPLGRGRQAERADLMPRGVHAGLGRQTPVQVGPVHHHLRERHRAPELAHEPGGMERRARGQLGAVDQDDLAPAELGQVVGDRGPADTAADDDCPGVLDHRDALLRCPPNRRPEG